MKKLKVLFVCLGNICRSPMAEAILKHKIAEHNMVKQFEVDSCGTSNYHIGETPDERTIINATKNGVKIRHRARQLTVEDLNYYDIIFVMDRSNYENTVRLAKNNRSLISKIKLMREFDHGTNELEVPDPYYGGEKGFQEVFNILDRSIENFLQEIRQKEST